MYSETCMNRSCTKAGTVLRRTDTFYTVCFLYPFLSRISKAETVKRTLLQTGNFFNPQIKKPHALCGHIKILGILDKERINVHFCQFSQKEIFLLHFKETIIFSDFILQFWRSATLLTRALYLLFQFALCNQLIVVLCHWKRYQPGTFKPNCTYL